MITTNAMLTRTVHGVPSGNYDGSSLFFEGDVVKAANYYQGLGNLQTVVIRVTEFMGEISIRATLETDPEVALWFEVQRFGDLLNPISGVFTYSIRGNFVWMKPDILDFSEGTIDSITVAY